MGVNLSPIVSEFKKQIDFPHLRGWVLAIDAYNTLYQFITTIRDKTGNPLRDSRGRVTSHLSGLFYRNVQLLKHGIKLVYVFDGVPPKRKMEELKRRRVVKEEGYRKYLEAVEKGDYESARKYAAVAATLEDYMVSDAKELLSLLGIPVVQAPSEGEAQAAYMARKGDVTAVASQDYDSLLFGAPKIVRNVTLTGTIKYPSKGIEVRLEPELVELKKVLEGLEISYEQLVDMGIIIGTDYNEGIKGIGPKKALEYIKAYGSADKIPEVLRYMSLDDIMELRRLFMSPEVTDDYSLDFRNPDYSGVEAFLCDEHDFSEQRVRKALNELKKSLSTKSLDYWF